MIADLKPYAEYTESGLPWLGDIPQHWASERAKWLFTKMDRPVREDDEVVTCFRDGMVTLRKNRRLRGFTEATVYSGYQGICKGDLVIHGMDAFAGAIGVSDSDGKGTPVYNVCQPRPGVNASYYAHLVRQMSQSQWILALAKGIRERSTDFRFEMFGNQRVPLPPPDEQAAIVRFLDWANGRLERAIRAKRKVIALLNEQKQAIIHRAVTRGLNPSVSLKPSGIPWLGDIPQHWEVRPLKQLLVRMDYGTSENVRGEGLVRVLTMGHIRDGKVTVPQKGGLDAVPPGLLLEKNDLLFNRTNSPELVGKVGLFAGDSSDEVTFASYLVRLRVRSGHNAIWLNYLLNSTVFWSFARSQALVSLHQANLNSKRYGQIVLPIPSRRAEQDDIVEYIRSRAGEVERASFRLEREIELLREYRTRLVADVVAGKLDVREAAARLPDDDALGNSDSDPDLGPELTDEAAEA
ncbi:MAG: restriction endonuclease subunit S [Candidatus Accumulibacter phosphatis]|uniref:restriction endonuclease subunit S n=1 Tax=Candidatus Accumulibacter phosphatis TaxID=327160 RepID=UPI001A5FAEBC|nr:restriction endonuclease subunit S [Candidatus Accumulibacter phosphatis]